MYNTVFHNESLEDKTFLITGGAGFIGSNIVEYLITFGAKKVRVLDNLSTGYSENIEKFLSSASFEFIKGDIRDINDCQRACTDIDFVSHQAALGSVPRSIDDPLTTNDVNISGFLNMLVAVKDQRVKRFVYAASSSTYGDSKEMPKVEERIGNPLSPYAVTKLVNELYANVFEKVYGIETIGLRYFNVFGPKQNPAGAYAAVVPLFIKAVKEGRSPVINGDGETTRDFTYIENVVQANIKALLSRNAEAIHEIYNVACGERTSLNQLWELINEIHSTDIKAIYREERKGDVRDSLAQIDKIKEKLDYRDIIKVREGLIKLSDIVI